MNRMPDPLARPGAQRIVIERIYDATLEDIWELWTTPEGIAAWWGPDGFTVTVRTLELRAGGALHYVMTATAQPQIDFMKRAGMPLSTEAHIAFREVVPMTRLAYDHAVDFVPGRAPYSVSNLVELSPHARGVRMVLTLDPMHDTTWTGRSVAGWESQLDRLAHTLAQAK